MGDIVEHEVSGVGDALADSLVKSDDACVGGWVESAEEGVDVLSVRVEFNCSEVEDEEHCCSSSCPCDYPIRMGFDALCRLPFPCDLDRDSVANILFELVRGIACID